MRKDVGLRGVMWDSVEELCLAVLLSLGFLLLIGKVNFHMPTNNGSKSSNWRTADKKQNNEEDIGEFHV